MAALAVLAVSAAVAQVGPAGGLQAPAQARPAAPVGDPADESPKAAPSRDAQLTYQAARGRLVQIRTLRRKTNTQSSVGSGFFVGNDGFLITNFHVASQLALEPERHRGVMVSVDGVQADLELIAFDVLHDLAVMRPKVPSAGVGAGLSFRSPSATMKAGERIYSLGNPLDIGFAVTEGNFNGYVQRSFYPRIFFGGALNPGMSGGPALDAQGRVIGVNVAKRLDAELVSFLVPAEFAQALLVRAQGLVRAQTATPGASAAALEASQAPGTAPKGAHGEVARQLLVHQEEITKRFTGTPLRFERHGSYRVPVPDERLARCWGGGRGANSKSYFEFERSDCRVDSNLFAGDFDAGGLEMRYEAYDGARLHPLQFAKLYSASFKNERMQTRGGKHKTAAECTERFIEQRGLPMRAVLCMSAYRKLPGLYELTVLLASVNQDQRGVQARLDLRGVAFENALKVAAHYIDGFAMGDKP